MVNRIDRPNVLWICTDQQRYDTIGALGNPHVRTPNLDRLVSQGVAFTHAYCQSQICTPSRAGFLTGMYPSTVHASMNGNSHWDNAAPLVTKTLAGAGYDCGLVGKLHLSAAAGRVEQRPDDGYRVFHWSHSTSDEWPEGHAYRDWLANKGLSLGELRKAPERIPPELHQTTWCANVAIDFIEDHAAGGGHAGQPWLMSVNCFDPHPAFDPPQEYRDHFDPQRLPGPLFRESDLAAQEALAALGIDFQSRAQRPEELGAKRIQAAYYAMIELIDDNLGRMLEALERTDQRENTLIIFTSDHGETLGDHGLLQKGCRFYEGLVRVPLIFSWPGRVRASMGSDALVELIDIVPTLLEVTGLPAPERMQGRSLVPILSGHADPSLHRDIVRTEYYSALGKGRGGSGKTYGTMTRDAQYKLVVYHGHDAGELFDLHADPGEFENLWSAPAYAGVRCDLMKKSFDALALAVDVGPEQVARF